MVKYIAREDSPLYEKISDLYKTSELYEYFPENEKK